MEKYSNNLLVVFRVWLSAAFMLTALCSCHTQSSVTLDGDAAASGDIDFNDAVENDGDEMVANESDDLLPETSEPDADQLSGPNPRLLADLIPGATGTYGLWVADEQYVYILYDLAPAPGTQESIEWQLVQVALDSTETKVLLSGNDTQLPLLKKLGEKLLLLWSTHFTSFSPNDLAGTYFEFYLKMEISTTSYIITEDTFYFYSSDAEHGQELWKSDGTETGTVMVADINPGTGNSYVPSPDSALYRDLWGQQNADIFDRIKDEKKPSFIYFTADDGSTGRQVWRTDGTKPGTVRLTRIETDADHILSFAIIGYGKDRVYFMATEAPAIFLILLNGGGSRVSLWESDGTARGTKLIQQKGDLKPVEAGSRLYMIKHYCSLREQELFATQVFIVNFEYVPGSAPPQYYPVLEYLETYFFVLDRDTKEKTAFDLPYNEITSLFCDTENHIFYYSMGTSLSAFDGQETTVLDNDLPLAELHYAINGTVFFSGDYQSIGNELWKIDSIHSKLLRDICPGTCSADPDNFIQNGDRLYFWATDLEHGHEPWVYRLTE